MSNGNKPGAKSRKKKTPAFLTIGILGGMGPEATSHFFNLIVKSCDAARDQEHVPVVVCSFPQMPDRVDAILRKGPSPLPMLIKVVGSLKLAGADFVVIPCITAHYFHPAIAAQSRIPLVNIVEETAADVRKRHPAIKTIGLIATSGTVKTKIFHNAFKAEGISVVVPDSQGQKKVMNAIYGGIKAGVTKGAPRKAILATASELIRRGAQGIVAGCTEIPLVLRNEDISVPLIDPMRIAARVSIERAGGRVKRQHGKDKR